MPVIHVVVEPRDVGARVALEIGVAVRHALPGSVVKARRCSAESRLEVLVERAGVAEHDVHVAVAVDVRVVPVRALEEDIAYRRAGTARPVEKIVADASCRCR